MEYLKQYIEINLLFWDLRLLNIDTKQLIPLIHQRKNRFIILFKLGRKHCKVFLLS